MFNLFDSFAKTVNIAVGHSVNNNERERTFAEILHQIILPDDSIHIFGEIIEHIIVYPCFCHADSGRDHQQQRKNKYRYAVFNNRF